MWRMKCDALNRLYCQSSVATAVSNAGNSWVDTLVPSDSSFCSIQVKKSPDCALTVSTFMGSVFLWYPHCKRPMLNYDMNFLIQQSLSKRQSSLENTHYSFALYLLGSQFRCVHSLIWVIKLCYGSFHGAADIKKIQHRALSENYMHCHRLEV